MTRWLHLHLYGPLAAFGGPVVDHIGPVTAQPGLSMLTGLIANALGWRRTMAAEHQRLQERVVYGSLHDKTMKATLIVDYQTAMLTKHDRAWQTNGKPATRESADNTWRGPHQRQRQYHSDARVIVALRLEPAEETPSLEQIAAALTTPARGLFLGRKNCPPSRPIFAGYVTADSVKSALVSVCPADKQNWIATWPGDEGNKPNTRRIEVVDQKDWASRMHGGCRVLTQASAANQE